MSEDENKAQNTRQAKVWIQSKQPELAYMLRNSGDKVYILKAQVASDGNVLWLLLQGNRIQQANWAHPVSTFLPPDEFTKMANQEWQRLKKKLDEWIQLGLANSVISNFKVPPVDYNDMW